MKNPNSDHSNNCVLIIQILTDDATHPQSGGLHHPADNASHGDESNCAEDCTRITKLQVNSSVLVEKSPFFHDLFMNAVMESEQRCVTLSIHASEETAVMELLNYMHSGTLTATTEPALLDVLKSTDKFQVVSCMRPCASLLTKMPMTLESALVYLSLLMPDEVRHLVDAAKQFVVTRFSEIQEHWSEIMTMPLAVVEVILSSDSLEPLSESNVFDLARAWVKARYPNNPEDQRKIFSTHLARHIRFRYMYPGMLTGPVLSCGLLDDDLAHKVVVDALYSQITTPLHHHRRRRRNPTTTADNSAVDEEKGPRAYYERLIRVVEFEFPRPEMVVYHDLCMPDPTLPVHTDYFRWGPHLFSLFACAREDKGGRLAVYLGKDDDAIVPVRVDLVGVH